ncbi:DinB family protein [Microbulbifer bruguierae]|uniref:DinB family protein n=1 Tax=Microbulbifer bruguierae TaxID=3029061 RepID=A0ABY8NAU6_9GAMM|nr:DinB family protein [Microbulbifer bruguierae]WGL16026.1 DinB family protein [Microbulbifer bruguierae]
MENQFLYKAWANIEILEKIGQISRDEHPEQWVMAVRLLNHTYVVDQIFIGHLRGEPHPFSSTNTKETPTIDELRENLSFSDSWLVQYVKSLDESSMNKEIEFTFTDGDSGSMSIREILNHLVIHGTYHRGNIGMLLTACGIDRPSDTFTRFLHQNEPLRRSKS